MVDRRGAGKACAELHAAAARPPLRRFVDRRRRFVANGWSGAPRLPTVPPSTTTSPPPQETAMSNTITSRFAALALAFTVTLAMLAGIGLLAETQPAQQLAAAVVAPRA
jgi:hypothetical protein